MLMTRQVCYIKYPTMTLLQCILICSLSLVGSIGLTSADVVKEKHIPFDLNGSNFTYPWPVKLYQFATQHGQPLEMAFMDISPKHNPNGKTAILLHGKNFCGPTWNATAIALVARGYRVILPDQIGFCKSSKPDRYQFSLQQLATNTLGLLKILRIEKATVIGHSLGGMLATRFALVYPQNVTELVLTNPIGLEDWKAIGVPYIDTDTSWTSEKASTYGSIRGYEQATLHWELVY
jgi:pimeloyl-ACP methyl ester carboxylesterase